MKSQWFAAHLAQGGKALALLLVSSVAAFSARASVLDKVLDPKVIKVAKLNDGWYTTNRDRIHIKLDTLEAGTNDTRLRLKGTIENGSDDKLRGVVLEITIVNSANKQEALRERLMISAEVFRSETYNLNWLCGNPGESDIVNCLRRIKDYSWSFQVIAVLGNASGIGEPEARKASKYFKVKSFWKPEK